MIELPEKVAEQRAAQRERVMLSVVGSLLSGPFAHLQGEPKELADKAAAIADEIVRKLRETGNK